MALHIPEIGKRRPTQRLVLYTTRPTSNIIDVFYTHYWESIDYQNKVSDWDYPEFLIEDCW